jgi:hypothetical protein
MCMMFFGKDPYEGADPPVEGQRSRFRDGTLLYPAQCPGVPAPLAAHDLIGINSLDDALQRYTQIYPAGGANQAIFGITLAQLAHISGGTFADVKRDP